MVQFVRLQNTNHRQHIDVSVTPHTYEQSNEGIDIMKTHNLVIRHFLEKTIF